MLLNASTTSVVGPAITARKFDPGHDPVLTLKWDAWMARKLAGEAAPGPRGGPNSKRARRAYKLRLYSLQYSANSGIVQEVSYNTHM